MAGLPERPAEVTSQGRPPESKASDGDGCLWPMTTRATGASAPSTSSYWL